MTSLATDLDRAHADHATQAGVLAAVDAALERHDVRGASASFARADARDRLGLERQAVPLYREALDQGLGGTQRVRCLVQLGSSLRNVGQAGAAVDVLLSARREAPVSERDGVDAFLALALHSHGETARALAVALGALAPHLTAYRLAVASYADALTGPT